MGSRGKCLSLAAMSIAGLMWASAAFGANVDTVYLNGKIYLMDDIRSGDTYDFTKVKDLTPQNARTAEVVAVKDGKIVFVGSRSDAEAGGMLDATTTVDLEGRTMLPGFIDGHGHFPSQGEDDLYKVFLGSEPLGTMTSIADYVEALNSACENARPGDGVLGSGYDDTLITDMRHPTWEDIEGAPACKGKDVRLSHISGHVSVVSKALLEKAGLMNEDGTPTQTALDTPGVVLNDDGKVTGILMETVAMGAAGSPQITQDGQKALARANDVYLAKGVVMGDLGGAVLFSAPGLGTPSTVTLQTGLANGNLTLRTMVHPILNALYGGAGNLLSLGWEGLGLNEIFASSQEMVDSNFRPGQNSPVIGGDITKRSMLLTPDFTPDPNLPDDMMFLGAYKILGDGSPQAYTAWMKDPGNYNWGDYTAENRFALFGNVDGHSPIYGTKYDTTKDSAAPTEPPYFNGLPGTVNVYPTDLQNLLEVVHRAGHSTEIHCNGSAYAEAWIEALEKTVSKHPEVSDTRHCSIHAQTFERNMLERIMGNYATVNKQMTTQLFGALGQPDAGQPGTVWNAEAVNGMSEAQLSEAMKKQNIVPNYFVTHTYFYGERHKDIFFGPGRANNISPAGWTVALGTPYAFHNDTDVTPIDPLQSVESAVTRMTAKSLVSDGGMVISGEGKDLDAVVTCPSRVEADGTPIPGSEMQFYNYDQRINVAQALLGVTLGPVYQNKLDDRTGTIEVGKFADFVILDDDPMQVGSDNPTRLSDIRITTTIVNGKPLYGVLPGQTNEYGSTFNLRPSFAPAPVLPADVVVTVNEAAQLKIDDPKLSPLEAGWKCYGAWNVEGTVNSGDVATLQLHMLGNGMPAQAFMLLVDGQKYEMVSSDISNAQSAMAETGKFWIAPAEYPKEIESTGSVLARNADYLVNFTMPATTSAGADARSFGGLVEVVSQGDQATNWQPVGYDDDDSGGCTIGTTPAYDLAILTVVLLAFVGINFLRRRFASGGQA